MSTSILMDPSQKEREEKVRTVAKETQADNLEKQLSNENTSKIPEKFKGKSAEEIAESYTNLEKELSRKNNELGQIRSAFDQLVPLERKVETKEQREPVKTDDLFDNPEKAITSVVDANPAVQRLNDRADALERNLLINDFTKKHSAYQEDLNNPRFTEWIKQSPYRFQLAGKADKYDFGAADELWSLWEEYKTLDQQKQEISTKKADKQEQRERQEIAGTLESGTGNSTENKKVYSRAEIVDLKKRAMQGDRKAQAQVDDPTWKAEINRAYLEKRVQ